MFDTLKENSRFWLGAFVLLAFGSLSGCLSDDSDSAEDDETGGTGGSGTGGSSGSATGGSSGSATGGSGGGGPAGTACAMVIVIPTSSPLISDFEGYEGQMPLKDWSSPLGGDGASGVFTGPFGYGDHGMEAGQPIPETFAMVEGNDSEYALGIADSLAEEYGGGMGMWLSACLDASAFTGISFWVRGIAPTGMAKLSLLMNETTSAEPASATAKKGTCPGIDSGDMPTCIHPSYMFSVTDDWTEVRVAWSAMTAGDAAGTRVAPDGQNIWQIQFDVGLVWVDDGTGTYEPTPAEYEFEVDDMAFY